MLCIDYYATFSVVQTYKHYRLWSTVNVVHSKQEGFEISRLKILLLPVIFCYVHNYVGKCYPACKTMVTIQHNIE